MPTNVRITVTIAISVMNLFENSNADFLPFFSRFSLKIGIKLAEIAEANIASKKTLGIRLAV